MDDYADILTAEVGEITRQEGRVDTKAAQLSTVAGTLCTLTVATMTFGRALNGWVIGSLFLGALLWAAVVVILLRKVIRPNLVKSFGHFTSGNQLEELKQLTLQGYQESKVLVLGQIVVTRYRAVRIAANLLMMGFVPLLLSALFTIV